MPKIKKEKNTFVAHFHKILRSRPLTPFDLHPHLFGQIKDLIKLHNPDKSFEDSSFDSQFSDLQKLA